MVWGELRPMADMTGARFGCCSRCPGAVTLAAAHYPVIRTTHDEERLGPPSGRRGESTLAGGRSDGASSGRDEGAERSHGWEMYGVCKR